LNPVSSSEGGRRTLLMKRSSALVRIEPRVVPPKNSGIATSPQ
jgi:hypothetical protein